MPTSTTYMGLSKPSVGGDSNTWGTLINADLDSLDALSVYNVVSVSITGALSVYNGPALIKATGGVGGITLTLPDATITANKGRVYIINKVDSAAGTITVNTTSAQTISGASSTSISQQWHAKIVQSDGANWVSVGTHLSDTTTGTGSNVLSASPAFTGTVGLPIVTLTGAVTNYNSIATVSNGVPSEYATVDLTAQTVAKTSTLLYAVPSGSPPVSDMYRISWSAAITTADSGSPPSSTLGGASGFQVNYTSPTDSVSKTTIAQADWSSSANTTGTAVGGTVVVYAKAGTNINYTFGYTSSTNTMAYELHIKLEAL